MKKSILIQILKYDLVMATKLNNHDVAYYISGLINELENKTIYDILKNKVYVK